MDDPATRRLELARLDDTVRGRASVRRFLPDPVPREDVTAMVELAVRAANAGNAQMWRFVAVDDPETRAALRRAVDDALDAMAAWPELAGGQREIKALRAYATFFADAPLVLAVFALPYASRADEMLDARGVSREEHDRLRARPDLQSVGAAVQLFCTRRARARLRRLLDDRPRAGGAGDRSAARRRARRQADGARTRRAPGRRRQPHFAPPAQRRPRVSLTMVWDFRRKKSGIGPECTSAPATQS